MSRDELRALLPERIEQGALLRSDGSAVGLVGGGAIPSDLMAREQLAVVARDYHLVLQAQAHPIHVYIVDQPVSLDEALCDLLARQGRQRHPLQRAILGELADRLADAQLNRTLRIKQTVWALHVGAPVSQTLKAWTSRYRTTPGGGAAALREARDRARRLADALSTLGGHPTPRMLEQSEIMLLLLGQVDPLRAQRYPLTGDPMARVHQIVTALDEVPCDA